MFIVYKLCAYDRFIKNEVSFWCDLMTDEDREVLEYGQDIKVHIKTSATDKLPLIAIKQV